MKKITPLLICFFLAFICPIIISWEFEFLSGNRLGVFGTAISMILCILFAIGVYKNISENME